MNKTLSILAAAALLAGAAHAQCSTLSYFGAYNGQKGTMFEIQNLSATTPMIIGSFDQAFTAAGTADMEIYTIAGTCAGLELNAAAWTLVGSAAGVVHTGATTNPAPTTPIPISIGITIPPGAVQSFYITATNVTASTVYYTSGAAQYGVQYAANSDLGLIGRTGMSYPYGSNFGVGAGGGRLWNGIVHYCPGGSGTFAASVPYGSGCGAQAATFYEHFTTTPSIDLSNTAFQMLNTGTGYVVLPSATAFVAPSGTATNLNLGDDTVATVTLSSPFTYPGGSTSVLEVCSNGFISVAPGNGTSYQPIPASLLARPHASFNVWHDFICNASGNVWFEEVGGVAIVTWLNVIGYVGTTAGTVTSTFQLHFDLATGNVTFVFDSMDTISVSTFANGDGYIVGYSPNGSAIDPGSIDLSVAVPGTFTLPGSDSLSLALATSLRPLAGTNINWNTTNIPAGSPFGALLLGFTQFNPGIDLTGIGMAGCSQYTDGPVTIIYLTGGNTSVSQPYSVPNFLGVQFFAQSAVFAPQANVNSLGFLASQGLALTIGNQ